jgi:hypothetical protein
MTEDEYYDLKTGDRFIWEDRGRKGIYEVIPDRPYAGNLIAQRVSGDGLGKILPPITDCARMERLPPERTDIVSETDSKNP